MPDISAKPENQDQSDQHLRLLILGRDARVSQEVARLARTGDLTIKNICRRLGLTYTQVKYSLKKQGISIRQIKAGAGIGNPWPTLGPQLLDSFRKDLRAMGFTPGNRFNDIVA